MTTRKDIAEAIFPEVKEGIADLQKKYPARKNETHLPDGQVCSRVAPSPTGFLHLGVLFASFVPFKFVHQNNGTFILRIEDTDQKRSIEWGVDQIIDLLKFFGIEIDEGPLKSKVIKSKVEGQPDEVEYEDVGDYWPYIQSQRKYLYQVFVKELIANGKAYPCRMTEAEMDAIREQQMKTKVTPGIYGNYSVRRNKDLDEIMAKMKEDKNFIIRFRSHGDITKRIVFEDVIRGKLNMIDNYNDVVLIKWDGLPTYHMAHIVDDHLMRVSHVIRAEERLMSVPLHLQLFEACGLTPPKYCHVAQLLKLEDGKKRKLSKRKDPEANVEFFFERGVPTHGIIDYILTMVDPFFEEWQKTNPEKDYHDYTITLEKMSKSGALFDLTKLDSVSNAYLSRISTDKLYDETLIWAKKYDSELTMLLESDHLYAKAAMNIERHTPKDPKRFTTFVDVDSQIRFFFDAEWEKLRSNVWRVTSNEKKTAELVTSNWSTFPANLTLDVVSKFIREYIEVLDLELTQEAWFEQLKQIGKKHGFVPKSRENAEFKEWGYIGKVGDLAMLLRLQLCCTARTPDLFSVMKVMGKERVISRLKKLI